MIIFPAIDIRGGKCVRLVEGRFDRETVFADNPVDMALKWHKAGAQYLHLVDLDGAVAGKPVNLDIIRKITQAVPIPVQTGGGIRTMETIGALLAAGVHRVILGSAAVKDQGLVEEALAKYKEKIVIGIDAKDGLVKISGWGQEGGISAEQLAEKMALLGVKRIIYTDIGRDGTLGGLNVEATAQIAIKAKIPIIASGGVRGLSDIAALKQKEDLGIEGVIVGKAIYTGDLNLEEALKLGRS